MMSDQNIPKGWVAGKKDPYTPDSDPTYKILLATPQNIPTGIYSIEEVNCAMEFFQATRTMLKVASEGGAICNGNYTPYEDIAPLLKADAMKKMHQINALIKSEIILMSIEDADRKPLKGKHR